jgi:LacI family transcriptional regulator
MARANSSWVSLADVARESGVSSRTVARVMSDRSKVADATAERVEMVARRLGYRSNEIARSLKGGRTRTLGLIVPNIANPFNAACCSSIEDTARRRGYALLLCDSNMRVDLQAEYVDLLVRRRVDGLLITPMPGGDGALAAERIHHIPVVSIDRPAEGSTVEVLVTNEAAAFQATQHLIEHGHERILFLGQSTEVFTTQHRRRGYEQAMEAAGLEPVVALDNISVMDVHDQLGSMLKVASAPTAVVAGNSVLAAGVLHYAAKAGIVVPDDLAVVGFDDFDLLSVLSPGLATVRQPTKELGQVATDAMIDILEGKEPEAHQIVLPTTLVPGTTCGCAA